MKKSFFDDLPEPERSFLASEEADGFFDVGHELVVLVGDQDAKRSARHGSQEFIHDLGGEREGDIMGVDDDAGAVGVEEPCGVAFLHDRSAHEPQL